MWRVLHATTYQSTIYKSQLSPFTMWVLRIDLGLTGLVVGTFTHWVIKAARFTISVIVPCVCQVLFCTMWWLRKNCKMSGALKAISQQRFLCLFWSELPTKILPLTKHSVPVCKEEQHHGCREAERNAALLRLGRDGQGRCRYSGDDGKASLWSAWHWWLHANSGKPQMDTH